MALAGCAQAFAQPLQTSKAGLVRPGFQIFNIAKQENTVTTILQTRDGYLWLGTYTGLVRYDGVRRAVFDSGRTPGLKTSRITTLYEDDQGVLWIGHETGELTRLTGRQFHPVEVANGWPGGAVDAITADERGRLWLLNDNGILVRYQDGLRLECPGGASPSRKAIMVRDAHGKIWVDANGIVSVLEGDKLIVFPLGEGVENVERIAPSRGGGLWVISNRRIRKWFEGRWVFDAGDCPCVQLSTTGLCETRSGMLLVGTVADGVYVIAPGSAPLQFNREAGLSHNWVRCIAEDHEGNLWLGTGVGLDTLRQRRVQMLNAPDGWQGCALLSFSVRPDGSAWIGTEGAGLYRYTSDTDSWTSFREDSGISNAFIWSVLETSRGDLLLGTWGGGLFRRDGERFERLPGAESISAPVVALYEGRGAEIWIGTTAGLNRYENGKVTWSAGRDQLAFPDVRAIVESPDGTIWFGMSGGGLGCLRKGVLTQVRKKDGLSSDFIQCLYLEEAGTLWLGSSENGLIRLKKGRFAAITTERGLPGNVICHIVDDQEGNFWISSNSGIARVSKAALNRCADGQEKQVRCLSFGRAEGLTTLNSSGGFQPGGCRTPDGLLRFPTAKGLAVIDPKNVGINLVRPPVVIEGLLADGEPVPRAGLPGVSVQIPAGKQRFEVHYTGLSFAAPEQVRFKYKLEGLEHDWVEAEDQRVAPYTYLQPGSYTFHVIACNNDEIWNEAGATLSFTLLPLFYQTWWFQGGALLAGAGAVGAVVWGIGRRRVRRKVEAIERQRALERERARIARDIHDDLGASLTRITMLSQSVQGEMDPQAPAAPDVDAIYHTARELTRALDEIVWAVNPKHDTLDSLVTYLGRFAQHFLSVAGLRCRIDVPVQLPAWALTVEIRHNIFLAFKEALNNVVKHAGATEVRVSLEINENGFVLLVADNGHGFDWDGKESPAAASADGARLSSGNGLVNMQKRLEELNGRCEWTTAPGEGTRVRFIVPVKNARH